MRVLHTSDWHLGATTGPASRVDEQERFLTWLLGRLAAREVDALVVAGDVFDTMHPSSEAQRLYYRFLASVADTGTRDVVVVGGNHDSPARLDAPQDLLEALGVHVVGGVPAAGERNDQMLAPLRARGSDAIAAVCLAVPYVHEYRLGIRTTDLDREATRAAFRAEFAALYTGLADHASATYPGLPVIATGHLTLGTGSTRADYPQEIHQVGTIEGLPVDVLDPRIAYTALGHIHRCYPVASGAERTAWYSGSPIPYALTEMRCNRHVLLVDVDVDGSSRPMVDKLVVPVSRELVQISGPADAVLAELSALDWTTPLAPLVHIRVETPLADPGLIHRLHEVNPDRGDRGRAVLVEVQQRSETVVAGGGQDAVPSLDAMRPAEVFDLMCDAKGIEGPMQDELRAAFATIAGLEGGEFDRYIAKVAAEDEDAAPTPPPDHGVSP